MSETFIVLALIVLGGLLPLVGLFRVALRVWRNLPEADRISVDDRMQVGRHTGLYPVEPFANAARATAAAPILEWGKVRWDLVLVGGGILCGSIGSFWSVFL